jgi:drug/metabolite transporter (DMT)-like permease
LKSTRIGEVLLWMSGALVSFSTMAVSVRELAHTLNVFEILAVRNASGLAVLGTLAIVRPELRLLLKPERMGLHLVRNVVHFASQCGWALSLTLLPLATVFALEFTAPLWVALMASLLLGEQMTRTRIIAVVLGFLGVLVILRPGFESLRPAALLMLAVAVGFALTMTLTKKLTGTVSTFAILFWMNAIQLPLNLVGISPSFAGRMGADNLLPLAGLAIAGLASHFCLTNAFRAGDATIVVPLDFLRLPLIAVVGAAFYGERFDPFVFAGAALIIAGILCNLRAEARRT